MFAISPSILSWTPISHAIVARGALSPRTRHCHRPVVMCADVLGAWMMQLLLYAGPFGREQFSGVRVVDTQQISTNKKIPRDNSSVMFICDWMICLFVLADFLKTSLDHTAHDNYTWQVLSKYKRRKLTFSLHILLFLRIRTKK